MNGPNPDSEADLPFSQLDHLYEASGLDVVEPKADNVGKEHVLSFHHVWFCACVCHQRN